MKFSQKAIVFRGPEDIYGSCGCGMDMAILPVLLPKAWYFEECPFEVDDHQFCRGDDARRIAGFSCSNVFEHEMEGQAYLANFSCCRDCAQRAVENGYAVWSEKGYSATLR